MLKIAFTTFSVGVLLLNGCTTGSYERVASDYKGQKVIYRNGPKVERYCFDHNKKRYNCLQAREKFSHEEWRLHAYRRN